QDKQSAKHHRIAEKKTSVPKEWQVNNWFLRKPQFPNDESDDPDDGKNRKCENKGAAEPIVFLAFVEHDLEAAESDGDKRHSHIIHANPAASRAFVLFF